ncbi:MAG: tetratricopeptide repeat protein [bacterium]
MHCVTYEYRRIITVLIVFLPLFLLVAPGCRHIPEPTVSLTAPPSSRVNCILISIDTLRADHLHCYGYEGIKTPHIDALASEGIRFSRAYSAVPVTLPSHSTMMTGLFPIGHGVRNNGTFRLEEENTTLAEIFQQAGYRTGAFIGAFVLDSRFGLNQGFDVYDDHLNSESEQKVLFYNERPAEKVVESAIEWIDDADNRPFFAFIHCFDPHAPYDPPSPIKEEYMHNLYDGEIRYVDEAMGRLFSALKEMDLFDTTLICFTSDHGEGLGDHGEKTHAIFIYDPTIHVPLIFRYPARISPGQVVHQEVCLTDIFPTILDLAGLRYNGGVHGMPLLRRDGPPAREFEMYCETFYPLYNHKWSPLEGIRTADWKLIRAPRSELYHLSEDPNESVNLYEKNTQKVREMESRLDAMIESFSNKGFSHRTQRSLDKDTRDRLESLGYMWTASIGDEKEDASYPDPKDMIGLLEFLNRGTYFYMIGDFDRAIEEFKSLLKVNPNDVFTHFVLGYVYDKKGWTDMAIEELKEAIRLDPQYINAYNNLGTIYNRIGRIEDAIQCFNKSIELNPTYIEAYDNLGVVYYMNNDFDKAMGYFHKAIEIEPTYAQAYNNMGSIFVARNRFAEAVEPIRKALEYDPNLVDAYNNLGSAYLGLGRLEEAEGLFMEALAREPDHNEARINLATVYIQVGKHDEAHAELKRIIDHNPHIPKAYNALGTLLVKEGRLDEAIEKYKESIYLDPTSAESYYNLGIAYFGMGRIDEAIYEYTRALNIDPSIPGAYVNMGIAKFHKGFIDQSISDYRKALEFDPMNVEAMVNLGVAYYNLGMFNEAIEQYTRALSVMPDNVQARINLGLAYFGKGQIDEAIEAYQNVLKMDPDHIDARVNLGVAYFNQQRFREAIREYQEVTRRQPQNFQAFYGIGYSHLMLGSYQDAIENIQEALRIKPDYVEGRILLEKAMGMAALGIRPSTGFPQGLF